MRHLDRTRSVNHVTDFLRVLVAPTAKLETQGKVRRHERLANDAVVLPGHSFRLWAKENEEFQHPSNRPESEPRIRHRYHVWNICICMKSINNNLNNNQKL